MPNPSTIDPATDVARAELRDLVGAWVDRTRGGNDPVAGRLLALARHEALLDEVAAVVALTCPDCTNPAERAGHADLVKLRIETKALRKAHEELDAFDEERRISQADDGDGE